MQRAGLLHVFLGKGWGGGQGPSFTLAVSQVYFVELNCFLSILGSHF